MHIHEAIAKLNNWSARPGNEPHKPTFDAFISLLNELSEERQRYHERIENMARTFTEAAAVLIAHDKQATADAAGAATNIASLTQQLADANAKMPTPEVAAAQQTVIDQAEADVPSA